VGGGFMDAGFLGGCQRSHWEIQCDCHLSGCWMRIQCECNIVQVC